MARVLAPYGIQGWIKARTYTASIDALLNYSTWWLAPAADAEAWRKFEVKSARQHGDTLVALLDGIADRETAAQWRGAWLAVPRASLPAPDAGEFYWSDLVSLTVVNRAGQTLGQVGAVLETGAHPVLQVERVEGEEGTAGARLIPVVADYVDMIDPASGRITVNWPADY